MIFRLKSPVNNKFAVVAAGTARTGQIIEIVLQVSTFFPLAKIRKWLALIFNIGSLLWELLSIEIDANRVAVTEVYASVLDYFGLVQEPTFNLLL